MKEIVLALGRATRSLFRRDIFWHLVWPGVAAMLIWTVVAILAWTPVTEWVFVYLNGLTWVGSWISSSEMVATVMLLLVKFAVALAFVPLVYLTATLLVAAIALPLMLERVGRRDYGELELRRGGSTVGSVANSLLAGLLFLVALLVSLPFWLIPGVGLVVTVGLTGWLNQRAFGYDALMEHADREELQRLREEQRPQMLLLGGAGAMLAYVPLVNVVAPALAGLSFVHYLLEILRRDRSARAVAVLEPLPPALPAAASSPEPYS